MDSWFKNMRRMAKQYGPMYKLYVGNQLVLVLADADAVHDAFVKQGDAFAGRPSFHVFFPEEVAGIGEFLVTSFDYIFQDPLFQVWSTRRVNCGRSNAVSPCQLCATSDLEGR